MNRNKTVLALAVMSLAVFAAAAQAEIIGPLGGGPYRLAFVGSVHHNAVSPDIADYNAHMQGLADAAGLGDVTWNVIGSTEAVAARDNTGTNPAVDGVGVPIYLVDGITKVADDNADLWDGDIDHIIDQTETGGAPAHLWIFSGTKRDGTPADNTGSNFGPFGQVGGDIQQGKGFLTDEWICPLDGNWVGDPPGTVLPMYAMSEIIPEPSTFTLAALGLLGLIGFAWRRRK